MHAPTLVALAAGAALRAAAQSKTDEASAAQITNPAQECQVYSYAPVAAFAKTSFPTIWQPATLLPSDSVAVSLFNSLNSSIPNISPKGTPAGDFSSFTPTYPASDPDCWWTYHQCITPKAAGVEPDVATCPEPSTWGYTFDDGPNCSHNAFYDYLQAQKQKATMFYIGSNVLDWPLEAQRGLADGHEICAHTWSHRYMTALTNEEAFAELYYSKKAIKDVVGVTPQCWRPPYGDVDDRIRYIAQALGMKTILWVENTFDYEYTTLGLSAVEQNYQNIITKGKNGTYATSGAIVLSHELDNTTMTEAQSHLSDIKGAFKNVVPVAVCQNNTKPYVEQDVVYPNFSQYVAGTTTISLIAPTAADAAISLPLSSGATGSILATGTSAPGAQTAGSSSAAASLRPDAGQTVALAVTAAGVMAGWAVIASLL